MGRDLKMRLLQNFGEFCSAVVSNAQSTNVTQNLSHKLNVILLHCLQFHILQTVVSLNTHTSFESHICLHHAPPLDEALIFTTTRLGNVMRYSDMHFYRYSSL